MSFFVEVTTPNTPDSKGEKMPTLGGYVSQEIYDKYDALAREKGITKSKLVGQAITTSKIVAPSKKDDLKLQQLRLLQELKTELRCISENVNQISKHCNINKRVDLEVVEKLGTIERLLEDVRQKI